MYNDTCIKVLFLVASSLSVGWAGTRVGVDDGVGVSCGGGGVDGGVDVGEHGDALNVMRRGGLDGIFYGVRASQDPCCCSSS